MLNKNKLLSDLHYLINYDKEKLNILEGGNNTTEIIMHQAYLNLEEILVERINQGDYDIKEGDNK